MMVGAGGTTAERPVGRRQFVLVLASVAWPFWTYAQPPRMQVVGFLSSLNVAAAGPVVSASK
jgi:hypothetical protein